MASYQNDSSMSSYHCPSPAKALWSLFFRIGSSSSKDVGLFRLSTVPTMKRNHSHRPLDNKHQKRNKTHCRMHDHSTKSNQCRHPQLGIQHAQDITIDERLSRSRRHEHRLGCMGWILRSDAATNSEEPRAERGLEAALSAASSLLRFFSNAWCRTRSRVVVPSSCALSVALREPAMDVSLSPPPAVDEYPAADPVVHACLPLCKSKDLWFRIHGLGFRHSAIVRIYDLGRVSGLGNLRK